MRIFCKKLLVLFFVTTIMSSQSYALAGGLALYRYDQQKNLEFLLVSDSHEYINWRIGFEFPVGTIGDGGHVQIDKVSASDQVVADNSSQFLRGSIREAMEELVFVPTYFVMQTKEAYNFSTKKIDDDYQREVINAIEKLIKEQGLIYLQRQNGFAIYFWNITNYSTTNILSLISQRRQLLVNSGFSLHSIGAEPDQFAWVLADELLKVIKDVDNSGVNLHKRIEKKYKVTASECIKTNESLQHNVEIPLSSGFVGTIGSNQTFLGKSLSMQAIIEKIQRDNIAKVSSGVEQKTAKTVEDITFKRMSDEDIAFMRKLDEDTAFKTMLDELKKDAAKHTSNLPVTVSGPKGALSGTPAQEKVAKIGLLDDKLLDVIDLVEKLKSPEKPLVQGVRSSLADVIDIINILPKFCFKGLCGVPVKQAPTLKLGHYGSFEQSTTQIIIKVGNMMSLPVDVVVNAANQSLQGGGGIDGIITANRDPKTGLQLDPAQGDCSNSILHQLSTLKKAHIHPIQHDGQLPVGQSVITGSGTIKKQQAKTIRYVIATVGPKAPADDTKNKQLYNAYMNSLLLAINDGQSAQTMLHYINPELAISLQSHPIATIAFPSVSTGIYSYPVDQAAPQVVHACLDFVRAHPHALEKIYLVFLSEKDPAYQALQSFVRDYKKLGQDPYAGIIVFEH